MGSKWRIVPFFTSFSPVFMGIVYENDQFDGEFFGLLLQIFVFYHERRDKM